MTKTEGQTLESVLARLGEAYQSWKTWEEAKNRYKAEFFMLADEAVGSHLAVMSRTYPGSESAARQRAELHNPGWLVTSVRQSEEPGKGWDCALRQDPACTPFAVEHDGYKYARSVALGPVMVDDDWLAEADPDLYTSVTYELPWGVRITRPIETLDPQTIAALARYIYHGKPRVALAVRKVKDE